MKIRTKLTAIILLASMIPLTVLGLISLRNSQNALREQIAVSSLEFAQLAMTTINVYLNEEHEENQMLASINTLQDIAIDDKDGRIVQLLTGVQAIKDDDDNYYVAALNVNGVIVASSNPEIVGINFSKKKWFQDAILGIDGMQDVAYHELVEGYAMIISSPIKDLSDPGKVIGVMLTALKWEAVSELNIGLKLRGEIQDEANHIMLTDKDGLIISCFDPNEMFTDNLIKVGMKSAKYAQEGKEGHISEISEHGHLAFSTYTYSKKYKDIPSQGWLLVMLQDSKSVFAPVVRLQALFIFVLIVTFILCVTLSFLLANTFSKPILAVAEAAQAIGKGDLERKVTVTSKDEIGILADSVNKMTTALSKSRDEIIAAKDYTDSIITSMLDCLVVIDPDVKVRTVNKATCDLSGYKEAELIGRDISLLFLEKEGILKGTKPQKLISENVILNYEINFKTKNGNTIPVFLSSAVMRDKTGEITGMVYVAKDITERKRAEEERVKLEDQVRHAQKMESIGTIANGIAHNFNNILGAVRGFIEMTLVDVPRDSRANSDLKKAVKGIEDAKELSNKMLAFSREQNQKLERVEIHLIVKEALELFSVSVTTPVEIREDIDTKCGHVCVDVNEIKQVVINLCTNAYHAMSEGKRVLEVGLKEVEVDTAQTNPNMHKGRYARITISDTGHGMDKITIERIFEPFFTTKEVGQGTGLGLSVAHGAILSHKGKITVDSELGKGTTFSVYLPLLDDSRDKKEV